MKKVSLLLLVLLCYGFGHIAFAQEPAIITSDKPGWYKVGEVKANFKMESESIVVLGKDEFKAIKLKVTDAPIKIEKVVVYYEGDEMEEIAVDYSLEAGAETKVHTLKYPTEEIEKVTFTYRSQPNYLGEKAHVELWALK